MTIVVTKAFKRTVCNTRLWLSDRAWDEAEGYHGKHDSPRPEKFWKKVRHFAINGFWLGERPIPPVIKHEWREVYRVGVHGDLFRLIGFYDGPSKHDFIVIDAFEKGRQKLTKAERKRIDIVADVKEQGNWKKKEGDNE